MPSIAADFDEPVGAVPLPVKRSLDVDQPWVGVIRVENQMGIQPDSPAIFGDPDVDLRRAFDLGRAKGRVPFDLMESSDTVFRVAGGCLGCCSSCDPAEGSSTEPCVHHGGSKPCSCVKGCKDHGPRVGEYLLIIAAATDEDALRILPGVTMDHEDWEPVEDEGNRFSAWSKAPMAAFVTGAAHAGSDVDHLVEATETLPSNVVPISAAAA